MQGGPLGPIIGRAVIWACVPRGTAARFPAKIGAVAVRGRKGGGGRDRQVGHGCRRARATRGRRGALRGRSGRLSVSVQAGDAGSAGFWAGGVAPLGFGAPRAEREAVGRAR